MRILSFVIVSLALTGCAEMAKKNAHAEAEATCASKGMRFVQKETNLTEGLFITTATVSGWCGEKPIAYASKLKLDLPSGWIQKTPTESMIEGRVVLYSQNPTIDAGMFLGAVKREDIADLKEFAIARMVDQASRLTDSQSSEIAKLEIQSRRAFRFEVAGTVKTGQKVTWLVTVIEGPTEIAYLSIWVSTANFERQKELLSKVANTIVGF